MASNPYEQVFRFTLYSIGPDGQDCEKPIAVRMCDYHLSPIKEHLLVAALLQRRTSFSDAYCASTHKILKQALHLAGLDAEGINELWTQAQMETLPSGNQFDEYYDALIAMTESDERKPSRSGYPLFDGRGNWGTADGKTPSFPDFNSCRLTCIGEEFAKVILQMHPEYKTKVLDLNSN